MNVRSAMTALLVLALASCSSKTIDGPPEDSTTEDFVLDTPPAGYVRVVPNTIFEGISWLAIALQSTDETVDFTGAEVFVDSHPDNVRITQQHCNRTRCGIVIEVDEFMDPTGQPIPPPIEAENVTIRVEPLSGEYAYGTLALFPLDYTDHATTSMPLRLKGTYMFSSFRMAPGTSLVANASDLGAAGRLFVSGPVVISGDMDLSGGDATGAVAGVPGLAAGEGGSPGARGSGPGGGLPGTGGGGGGGASFAGSGQSGLDGTGTGGAPGDSYGSMDLGCIFESFVSGECGGSGGGGSADAAGGGGGGVFLISSLDSILFEDVAIDVAGGAGGDGVAGGGGGSGGSIALVSPNIAGTVAIDVSGGMGGTGSSADGGRGGAGRIRIDSNTGAATITLEPDFHTAGPMVNRDELELIDTDGVAVIQGWAEPLSTVEIRVIPVSGGAPEGYFSGMATLDGTFSIEVELIPGSNRLRIIQNPLTDAIHSEVGNTFELAGGAVIGSMLYVVSIPDDE